LVGAIITPTGWLVYLYSLLIGTTKGCISRTNIFLKLFMKDDEVLFSITAAKEIYVVNDSDHQSVFDFC